MVATNPPAPLTHPLAYFRNPTTNCNLFAHQCSVLSILSPVRGLQSSLVQGAGASRSAVQFAPVILVAD